MLPEDSSHHRVPTVFQINGRRAQGKRTTKWIQVPPTIYHIYFIVLCLHGRGQILVKYRLFPCRILCLLLMDLWGSACTLQNPWRITKSMKDQDLWPTASSHCWRVCLAVGIDSRWLIRSTRISALSLLPSTASGDYLNNREFQN